MAWREESIMSQRLEFVTLASAEGANVRELCRRFRISAPTGYKWLDRHRSGGEGALEDASRRPKSSPLRSEPAIENAVLALRDSNPVWGARKLRKVLSRQGLEVPAISTTHAILLRNGRIDPTVGKKHASFTRFEHECANALWQLDFKGHVPMHRGGRCHPLTILDDHSRFSLGVFACDNEKGATVQEHLTTAFRRYGLPERVLCDNGPPWGAPSATDVIGGRHTWLTVWLLRLGVVTVHGRAFHPQTQGKAERFHRTLKAELLSRTDLPDLRQAQAAFDKWRDVYNLQRPHEALDLEVPATRYSCSQRAFPETLPPVEYAPGEALRRVKHDGTIKCEGAIWRIGQAFAGEQVALRPASTDGLLDVCYGPHVIGRIELRTGAVAESA